MSLGKSESLGFKISQQSYTIPDEIYHFSHFKTWQVLADDPTKYGSFAHLSTMSMYKLLEKYSRTKTPVDIVIPTEQVDLNKTGVVSNK